MIRGLIYIYITAVAEGFASSIKRQTALTQLAEVRYESVHHVVTMVPVALQVTRNTLRANNMLDQLKEDWSAIDLLAVYTQVLYLLQPLSIPTARLFTHSPLRHTLQWG